MMINSDAQRDEYYVVSGMRKQAHRIITEK